VAVTNLLPDNLFPSSIHGLLRTISRAGFFDRSVMIGSWVMLIYQELYGTRYALRTMDVDFAVHIAHTQSQLRADLKQLITGLGFTDYLAAEGVQKFAAGGYPWLPAMQVLLLYRKAFSPAIIQQPQLQFLSADRRASRYG